MERDRDREDMVDAIRDADMVAIVAVHDDKIISASDADADALIDGHESPVYPVMAVSKKMREKADEMEERAVELAKAAVGGDDGTE